MSEIKLFENEEFGEIRTVEINGEPHFVASDIAKALGYVRPADAITRHCRYTVKRSIPHPQSKTKTLEVNVIPEGDMYRLITHSELPSARNFESWVYDEVLPTLRKTGTYTTNTSYQYPVSAATIEAVASLGRLMERVMKLEGACPHEIAAMITIIAKQAGIELPDFCVKIPAYEQIVMVPANNQMMLK